MPIFVHSVARTDVGLKRTENEDNFLTLEDLGLFILADGMGGHNAGQLASRLAVDLIAEFVRLHRKAPLVDWPYGHDPAQCFEANLLANAVKYANERIFIESCKDRSTEGMGTTLTAMLQTDAEMILAHVGDSRIYRQRGEKLHQLTSDHSLLNHLLRTGQLAPEKAATFAQKNVILRAIGLKDYVEVEIQPASVQAGDVFLMCSDGLSDLVADPDIEQILCDAPSLDHACDILIQRALDAGGKDNVTVVCVAIERIGTQRPEVITQTALPYPPRPILHAVRRPSCTLAEATQQLQPTTPRRRITLPNLPVVEPSKTP